MVFQKFFKFVLIAVFVLFTQSVSAQTFFNFSASDTAEVKENESQIDQGEKRYTVDHRNLLQGSPLALGYSGANFNLPYKDPTKRNPLAPPPLSSDDVTLAENKTYQALVAFLQTCLISPVSAAFPGLNQSNVNSLEIPRLFDPGDIVNPALQRSDTKQQTEEQ